MPIDTRNQLLNLSRVNSEDVDARDAVVNQGKAEMRSVVKALKSVSGTGFEQFGQGDRRIIERREALHALLSHGEKAPEGTPAFDITAIRNLEFSDTPPEHPGGAGGNTYKFLVEAILAAAAENRKEGKDAADALRAGEAPFFQLNAQSFSTQVLMRLRDPVLRRKTMMDILLQLRNPIPKDGKLEKNTAGGAGAQSIFELRQNAASLLDGDSPEATSEYALMRALTLSNPRISTNAVMEARHVISEIRRLNWPWVYGDESIPEGSKVSVYSAIHHNYSVQTPEVIKNWVEKSVFTLGDAQSFQYTMDALSAAESGDLNSAKEKLGVAASRSEALRDATGQMLESAGSAEGLADAIAELLAEHCPVALDPTQASNELMGGFPLDFLTAMASARAWSNASNKNTFRARAELKAIKQKHPELFSQHFDDASLRTEYGPLHDKINAVMTECLPGVYREDNGEPKAKAVDTWSHALNGVLSRGSGFERGNDRDKFKLAAKLHRLVSRSIPKADELRSLMLQGAHDEWREIADVVEHLEGNKDKVQLLQQLGEARVALRENFFDQEEGHKRISTWALDQRLDILLCGALGEVINGLGDLKDDKSKVDALYAMQAALRAATASGLGNIMASDEAEQSDALSAALTDVDALLAESSCSVDDYRQTMLSCYKAIIKAEDNIGRFAGQRMPDVDQGKLIPNPAFIDDFIKESPIHFARAIAQKAVSAGLKSSVSSRKIVFPEGVTVLNPMGRVVFDRVLFAENFSDLEELNPGPSDLCFVRHMDEKKMKAMGGIVSAFPGGYCHAAVFSKGAGMVALSNHDINETWEEFAANFAQDKVFYSDQNGAPMLMPLSEAISEGLVRPDEVDNLKPGSNRHVKYLKWSEELAGFEVEGEHTVIRNPERRTNTIEIFTPAPIVKGLGQKCLSFQEAAALGIDGRALGGEKNTVLSIMSTNEKLKDKIPAGSYVPTYRCYQILEDAGILDSWMDPFTNDPIVGNIDHNNFLESRFYSDSAYRKETRETMLALVNDKVKKALLGDDDTPTAVGQALLDELMTNASLAQSDNWILRSSYTAEDRPNKSGAGQYDSVPNAKTQAERLMGVVEVLASAWKAPPVENNVTEEYNLRVIQPSITVMHCLNAEYSGVMVSRDTDTGYRRTVSYQVVEGFGGGVEGGTTEEGRINAQETLIQKYFKESGASLISPEVQREMWGTAMEIERLFHQEVEAGKGHAVDIEWVFDRDDQKFYIVQARTIPA